jgi:uncharacterized membrane protein YsdA (DUF1294 family)
MIYSGLAYQILLYYLLAVNTLCYVLFALDKGYAQRGEKRIAEKKLLAVSLIGGSFGGILAMYQFRHKTRQPTFKYGLPLILALQLALAGCYYMRIQG